MRSLTSEQLAELQQIFPWETATPLRDGRILGDAERRGCFIPSPDRRIDALREQFGDRHGSILELGPCEGYFTVQLAPLCESLIAVEARPKNVVATLIRLYLHGLNNVDLQLKDVREIDDDFGRFDVFYHAGVLYHLEDPVDHLFRVRHLSNQVYLETHFLADDDPRFQRSDIHYRGKAYRAYVWQELNLDDVWAGMQSTSRILHVDALLELLQDLGFAQIKIVSQVDLPFCPRVGLLTWRGTGPGQSWDQARQQVREAHVPARYSKSQEQALTGAQQLRSQSLLHRAKHWLTRQLSLRTVEKEES